MAAAIARAVSRQASRRVASTDSPCIVGMQAILRDCPRDVLSLAQGIVHWSPPEAALARAEAAVRRPETSLYGRDDGDVELCDALKKKLAAENGLTASEVMVTTGANQAYTNCVLALTDASDANVLYAPYYFNHLMAHQMTGAAENVVFGPTVAGSMQPDIDWLEETLASRPVKVVTITNPCNPTGVVVAREDIERASAACARAGATLILDNTYEYFLAPGQTHYCLEAEHVVNIFSFSKAYGLMGWRVGYIAYNAALAESLLKVQDTIPICPSRISQQAALGALEAGRSWVDSRTAPLQENLSLLRRALAPLPAVHGGEGAIYLLCELPPKLATYVPHISLSLFSLSLALSLFLSLLSLFSLFSLLLSFLSPSLSSLSLSLSLSFYLSLSLSR